MDLTEELLQYYLPYFKSIEEVEKALFFRESTFDQTKTFTFVKNAVEKYSKFAMDSTQEETGVINTHLYEINFAVLPTGDFVYYTVNKKTHKKGNYHRIMKLESIYKHLIKLGILDENISFEEVLSDAIFESNLIEPFVNEIQTNTKKEIDDEDNSWSSVSIDSSMDFDKEFYVINGSGSVILTTVEEEKEEEKKIGYIRFRIFNSILLNKRELWDAADAASGDEEWLMSIFLELFEEEFEEWSPKFLMLNTISIEKIYRSKGYGKAAIKELIQLCTVLDLDYIVLKPSPIEEVDFSDENKTKRKRDIKRLVSFYDQLGFDSYSIRGKEPIMVLDLKE